MQFGIQQRTHFLIVAIWKAYLLRIFSPFSPQIDLDKIFMQKEIDSTSPRPSCLRGIQLCGHWSLARVRAVSLQRAGGWGSICSAPSAGIIWIFGGSLEGSFSAVSKPNVAIKYAFENSRRDLHNALLCTVLESNPKNQENRGEKRTWSVL